jgi:hypothetical protein
VHGVGVRATPALQRNVAVRDALFRRCLLPAVVSDPAATQILNPLWGQHGAKLRWDHRSLPAAEFESLGAADEALAAAVASTGPATPASDRLLPETACRSLADAVDLLWTAAGEEARDGGDAGSLAELGAMAAAYVQRVEAVGPAAGGAGGQPWLAATNGEEFVVRLYDELVAWPGSGPEPAVAPASPSWEALGAAGGGLPDARDLLVRGARRLERLLAGIAGPRLVAAGRRVAAARTSLFLGDVLAYLAHRGTREQPGAVLGDILAALDAANQRRGAGEPVIVVAHSMGGNIVYDILSHFRPDLRADVLVTVGSQVGLFEELKLFQASCEDIPGPAAATVPVSAGIGRWINVLDRGDPLGYATEAIFDGAEDYQYPTGSLNSHSAYFQQPNFHARLGRRIGRLL